jgi:hypothetical protein
VCKNLFSDLFDIRNSMILNEMKRVQRFKFSFQVLLYRLNHVQNMKR